MIDGMYMYYVLIIILLLVPLVRYVYRRTGIRVAFKNTSVLLAQSTQGEVINGHQGNTPKGLPYAYLLGSTKLFSPDSSVGIYAVYLPFKTKAHLVGIPQGENAIQIRTPGSAMEPVRLEGDYQSYFSLFADLQQQADSRYVLDPKAMVFTIDFCKQFSWEIVDNTLYILGKGLLPSFDIVDQFVDEIRPAVESPAPKGYSQLPYDHAGITTLLCPICKTQLVAGESWMECPKQHGLLIAGGQMIDYRENHTSKYNRPIHKDRRTNGIKCPYCASRMRPTQFQATDIVIDVCTKCAYRWIDEPEALGVLGVKTPA